MFARFAHSLAGRYDFAVDNFDMLCDQGSCMASAVSALFIDASTEAMVPPFQAACSGEEWNPNPECIIYDDDRPDGYPVGNTEPECCEIVQDTITKFFEGTISESPVELASKMACGGSCGGIMQTALSAAELWYVREASDPTCLPLINLVMNLHDLPATHRPGREPARPA